MPTRFSHLPLNTKGRDFVVGDIHGAFDAVAAALRQVRYRPDVDRLLCVGDLVDRGPDSWRAQAFLRMGGVHAVSGNHERNLLDLYADGPVDERALAIIARRFDMTWWLQVGLEDRQEMLAQFAALPVVLEVETSRGLVGLVHGDVPRGMDWSTFRSLIERGDPQVLRVALEGRGRNELSRH